ncbi:MAG: hypothetical protein MUC41_09020 [Syntrophobacteraceae bacterium]|nr:hypothetical protein [Syntrophobacteraceae bacterium]
MDKNETPALEIEPAADLEEARVIRALELYNQACQDSGVRVRAWDEFIAWKKYVDGEIDGAQLSEDAHREIEHLSSSFGKYLVIEKDDSGERQPDEERKERAALASRIYRKACRDAGVALHFFHNFSTWSDFVNGKIGETELYERAMEELREMAKRQ